MPPGADLHGVAESCLFTLNARACESQRPDALFDDPVAEDMMGRLSCDTKAFDRDWLTQTGVAIRTEILDEVSRDFIARHRDPVLVNLGAGLCTRFFRVDDGTIEWIDIDDQAVIALRHRLLGTRPRSHCVAGSVVEDQWRLEVRKLAGTRPILFIAEGLLQYLDGSQVQRLVTKLASDFPGAEAAFEVISPFAVTVSRWQPSLRAVGVRAHWGLWNARKMERWSPRIQVVEAIFYDRHLPRWRWLQAFRWLPAVRKLMQIVHLRFAASAHPAVD